MVRGIQLLALLLVELSFKACCPYSFISVYHFHHLMLLMLAHTQSCGDRRCCVLSTVLWTLLTVCGYILGQKGEHN